MKSPWLLVLLVLVLVSGTFTLLLSRWEKHALEQLESTMLVTARAVADFAAPELGKADLTHLHNLARATQNATDTRVRILDARKQLRVDSLDIPEDNQPSLAFRREVRYASLGDYAGYTRLSDENPLSLALFVAYPIRNPDGGSKVVGIAYLSHTTDAILQQLGTVRRISQRVVAVLTIALFVGSLYVSSRTRRTLKRLRQKTEGKLAGGDDVEAIGVGIDQLVETLQLKVEQLEDEQLKTRVFLEDVAHELKTPLTGLTGSVEMLRDPVPVETRDRLLNNIQRESDRLSQLVSQLLELQNLDYYELRCERFDLVSLLETALDTYEYAAEQRSVRLELRAPDQAAAWGDADKLLSVVCNLVDNAIRCAPSQSLVEIECDPTGSGYCVAISDEGPGFDHSMLARRRRQGQSSDLGSCGLGLSIVSRILGLHGSQLRVEARASGGSRVSFVVSVQDV